MLNYQREILIRFYQNTRKQLKAASDIIIKSFQKKINKFLREIQEDAKIARRELNVRSEFNIYLNRIEGDLQSKFDQLSGLLEQIMNLNLTIENKRYIYNSDVEVPIQDMSCQEIQVDSFSNELQQDNKKERQGQIQDQTLELMPQQTSQIQSNLMNNQKDINELLFSVQSHENSVDIQKKNTYENPSQLISEDTQQDIQKDQMIKLIRLSGNSNNLTTTVNQQINLEKQSSVSKEFIELSDESSQLFFTSYQHNDISQQDQNQLKLASDNPDLQKSEQKIMIGVQRQYVQVRDIEKTSQYQCKLCTNSFQFGRSYRDHLKFIHEENAAFKCPSCDYSINQPEKLSNHLIEIHKIQNKNNKGYPVYECPYTQSQFKQRNALLKHIRNIQQYFDPRSN